MSDPGKAEEDEQWNVTLDGETAQRLRERYPVARDDSEVARMAFQEVLHGEEHEALKQLVSSLAE